MKEKIDQSISSAKGLIDEASSVVPLQLRISETGSSPKVRPPLFEELLEQIEIPMDSERIVPPKIKKAKEAAKGSTSSDRDSHISFSKYFV